MLYIRTAVVRPMPNYLTNFEIPVPADSELLKEYLGMGWYQLNDPPRLKWSYARGSPRHPGEPPEASVNVTLRMLDVLLLNELNRHLPFAGSYEGNSIEIGALVMVKFQKVISRQHHKGALPLATWKPADAELTVLPVDDGTVQRCENS